MSEVKRPRRQRGSLSRDTIIEAAVRLLDAEGDQALTFVRLGEELQSSSTAVYRHFDSRQDIVTSIADHLDGLSLAGYAPTDDWRADLEELAVRAWRTAVEHPSAAAIAMWTVSGGPNELRAIDEVLRALHAAGLRGREAVLHYQAFVSLVLSTSAAQAMRLSQFESDNTPATWTQIYGPVEPGSFPYAEAALDELRRIEPLEVFLMVVRTYLTAVGIAAQAMNAPT